MSCGDRKITTESPRPPAAATPRVTPLALADLMATGKIRVAFNRLNIACANTTPAGIAGPCVDIAADLAQAMGVRMEDRDYASLDAVVDAGRRGEWDVAFVALDRDQKGVAFTAPYLEIDQTYLVSGDSPFHSASDLDRAGVRVAVFSPSLLDRYLRANLKTASVVNVSSLTEGAVLIESGRADAYAGARSELLAGQWRLPNGRVLDDVITRNEWAIAVADGRLDLLAYVSRFLEDAKNLGVIRDAISRNSLEGARVSR